MKTQVNPPVRSKINFVALIIALFGVIRALDIISPELEEALTQVALTAGPGLIITFRTWFTEPK